MGRWTATDIPEGAEGRVLLVRWDGDIHGKAVLPGGAGALATFNRSIGPFEMGRGDPGYLQSVRFIDPAASGHAGAASGYRAPFYLPDGRIMVSYASNATAANFTIVAIDPRDGTRTALLTNTTGGHSYTDAV